MENRIELDPVPAAPTVRGIGPVVTALLLALAEPAKLLGAVSATPVNDCIPPEMTPANDSCAIVE